MSRNSEPCLSFDIPFTEIHTLLRAGIYDLDVHSLSLIGTFCIGWYNGRDDDESVGMCCVPDTLWRRVPVGLEGEFNRMRGVQKKEKEKER
jgi:hypothetical protein